MVKTYTDSRNKIFFLLIGLILIAVSCDQQKEPKSKAVNNRYVSKVWVADQGNGTYKNPILFADYSDPDVCRAGSDYYLVASSFDAVPGLPILHSKDLVNWSIIGHALKRQPPYDRYSKTQHGNGVWAPAIRYHNGQFYIYYPDPDFGIYMVRAKDPAGPWSKPVLVQQGKGIIDPCPFWDDNGNGYLIHAYAGSRAGLNSILVLNKINPEGTKVIDSGVMVYDGHTNDPTIEGPKLYKRNGYYYIFAPAGGVPNGWQVVLRSQNIYGPYQRKVVLHQGTTSVNGPHQGAWVTTQTGQSWFIHFQDRGVYGRVTWLEPMKWENDWPVIGKDIDGDGIGEPVLTYKKPDVGKSYPITTPQESDEFNTNKLGLQWQWQANPKPTWAFPTGPNGHLRLFAYQLPDSFRNYWDVPNILMQKFPAETFMATTKLTFHPNLVGSQTGLIIMGTSYAYLSLTKMKDGIYLTYTTCIDADKGNKEDEKVIVKLTDPSANLRVKVDSGAVCKFSYSLDGTTYKIINESFDATVGRWIGAKVGIFCTHPGFTPHSGYADFDWFRIQSVDNE